VTTDPQPGQTEKGAWIEGPAAAGTPSVDFTVPLTDSQAAELGVKPAFCGLRLFWGVDVGVAGGVGLVVTDDDVVVSAEAWIMPILPKLKGRRSQYDPTGMVNLLVGHLAKAQAAWSGCRAVSYAVVERSQPYPIQHGEECPKCHRKPTEGTVASHSSGVGYGVWLGLLTGLDVPFETIWPRTWQKHYGIGGKGVDTKAQAVAIVQQLFPDVNLLRTPRCKKAHDGMADALLIAEWGRRHYGGKA